MNMINTVLQLAGYIQRMRVAVFAVTLLFGMNVVNASGSWVIETADDSGNVGGYTSVALDANNKVHISYYDATNSYLNYATNVSGSWVIETVDNSGNVGGYTSIALDSSNKVHISYYDFVNGYLNYATNASGSWVIETVDNSGNVGFDTSIALDSSNKVHISYYDFGNDYLNYATNASGSWVIETVDNSGDVGGYTSIALDSSNKVHISYYDFVNGYLNYATNASGSWVIETVDDSGDVGGYTSVALDSNNKVHISYYDVNGFLKYVTNASGTWVIDIVDDTGDAGWYTSIAIDSNDKVHISYYDLINADLKYATNASGSWVTTTVDNSAVVDVGWDTSIYVSNEVHISYYDFTNGDLKYAHADTIAPDTSITSQPANPSNSTSASFTFTSTEAGSTFECQLDSAGYSICTSPKPYSGLATGSHTFEARATDPAGNTDNTPASYTWTIDTTPPAPEPGVTPAISFNGAVAVTNTAYSYSNIDISWTPYLDAVKYELDMGTVEDGTDLVNETSLTNITSYKKDLLANMDLFGKPVYITVKAVDQAGNESILKTSFVYTPADINSKSGQGDGRVDGFDLGKLGIAYDPFGSVITGYEAADIDRNGKVDNDDLFILAVNFGKVKP